MIRFFVLLSIFLAWHGLLVGRSVCRWCVASIVAAMSVAAALQIYIDLDYTDPASRVPTGADPMGLVLRVENVHFQPEMKAVNVKRFGSNAWPASSRIRCACSRSPKACTQCTAEKRLQ